MSSPNPYASPTSSPPPTQAPSRVRIVVLLWLSGLAAIVYTQRNSIAAAESTIREDLGVGKTAMGWAMGGFFITYAIFQLPTGRLADRWGSRKTLVLSTGVSSLAAALVGAASGIPSLLAARLGMGAGQAGVFPSKTNVFARWFPPKDRSTMAQIDSVLVVDDNQTNCEVIQEILDQRFDVVTASNGADAIRLAERHRPGVVLLDVVLPGMDGYEACRRLRHMPAMSKTRIVMVSAKAMAAERAQGLEAGADEYLTRPFDDRELLAAIRPQA
jgi:CheY-like chemotaxis protein